jgi:hypothetical protein
MPIRDPGKSSSRKPTVSRRAYRPDRHVYRDLRKGSRRRWTWVEWVEVAIALLVLAGIAMVVRWII